MIVAFPYLHITSTTQPDKGIQQIVYAHNEAFGKVQNYLQQVPQAVVIVVDNTGPADVPFAVKHGLGRKPAFAQALPTSDARVYATPADRAEWNERYIKLRCTVANEPILLKIEVI